MPRIFEHGNAEAEGNHFVEFSGHRFTALVSEASAAAQLSLLALLIFFFREMISWEEDNDTASARAFTVLNPGSSPTDQISWLGGQLSKVDFVHPLPVSAIYFPRNPSDSGLQGIVAYH